MPDGRLIELTEVNLTRSGMFIIITDSSGDQAWIHRDAWSGVIEAVQKLFEEEEQSAKEALAQLLERERVEGD